MNLVYYTEEEEQELIQSLREGEPVDIQIVAERYMGLALKLANKFAKKFGKRADDRDEIIGHAMLGLVYASNKLTDKEISEDFSLKAFFTSWITNYIIEGIRHSHMIYVPKRHRAEKGNPVSWMSLDGIDEESIQKIEEKTATEPKAIDNIVMRQGLKQIAQNEQQQLILEMRLEGKSDCEIAEYLSCTRANIGQIRIKMRRNLLRFLGAYS